MIYPETVTEFLNKESHSVDVSNNPVYLLRAVVVLGSKKFIQFRQVYDFMGFLGDVGGIYGSMKIIGAVLHFCISFNE